MSETPNMELINNKFSNMESSIQDIKTDIKDWFDKIDKRLDKQEEKFVTQDNHKLLIKDVWYLKWIVWFIGVALWWWLISKILELI